MASGVYHRHVLRSPVALHTALLWIILILAGTLRFWGLDFGMPFIGARPDEGQVVGTAAGLVSAGTLNPHFFAYPSLYLYALGAVYATVCGAGTSFHVYPTLQACLDADAQLILIGRAVTALTGTAAVAATYAVGRRLHPRAGLPAALLLAVAFLHVRESHFAVTDVPMTTMLLLALLLLLRADERPSPGRFAIAGLGAGLAAATKYNAAMLAAGAVASQIGAWLDGGVTSSDPTRRVRHLRLIVFGAAAFGGFFLATPYALLSREEFLRDVRFETWHLMNAHRRIVVDVGWRHHALVNLPLGVGWTLLAAGVAGMVWSVVRTPRQAAIIFAFPLIYYAVAGRGQTVFFRYMVPIVPFLCLGAAVVVASIHGAIAGRNRALATAAAVAILFAAAAPTAVKAIALDRLLSRTDSRVLAAQWIKRNVAPGTTILMTGRGFEVSPPGDGTEYRLWLWNVEGALLTSAAGVRPDWIVVEESPLRFYSHVPVELQPILRDYAFRHSVQAVRLSDPHVYDQQDAFYLPIGGFSGVARPGPNLTIYERRAETRQAPPGLNPR
jgi:hypothetical protein